MITSDYRTKKDVEDLPPAWDAIRAMRPIRYSEIDFQPPLSDEAKEALGEAPPPERAEHPLYPGYDAERWGFIAHEVQDILPTMANGDKDMLDGVQSLNLTPILAATVRALQEALDRIEALEATR